MYRLHYIALTLAFTAGCVETGPSVNCDEFPEDSACIDACRRDPQPGCEDAGTDARTDVGQDASDGGRDADAGGDADVDPDAPDIGGCTEACMTPTPFCDATTGECVACRNMGDCGGDAPICDPSGTCVTCLTDLNCTAAAPRCGDGMCVGCAGMDAVCERFGDTRLCGPRGSCAACTGSAQCMNPAMARCDAASGTCMPCTSSPDCAGTDQNVCLTSGPRMGNCVACTEATAAMHCGDFSCNPATNTCTTTERDTVPDCGRCVSDDECMSPDDRCVPMSFMGTPRPSAHCLRLLSAGCSRPYGTPILSESVSGEPETMYCGIDENSTTCDAVRALRTSTACTGASVTTDCADVGALCATVGAFPNRCTIPCGGPDDCPMSGVSATCGGSYCGS